MRPQNDGPALRAATLIEYANALIAAGQKAYVTQYLWNSDVTQPGERSLPAECVVVPPLHCRLSHVVRAR